MQEILFAPEDSEVVLTRMTSVQTRVVSLTVTENIALAITKYKSLSSLSNKIIKLSSNVDVVGIHEAQFFDDTIVDVCNELANSGKRVIVAGLDMDYQGKPFGPIPYLLAIAEYVTKVHAVCTKTGKMASYTHRIVDNDELILLGDIKKYEALSRKAFNRLNNISKSKKD